MQDGKLIETVHPQQHYRTIFNQQTGFFVRKEDKGYTEPSWAMDGPELIDLSITNYCERNCSFCYRRIKKDEAQFMCLDDVINVASQARDSGTLQIALGGGNPNQHPEFVEILRIIREYNIVPSYTTNGDGLTDDILRATAKFCGAMAVSVYPPFSENKFQVLLSRIKDYGITVNLHTIIKNDNIDLWLKWLHNPPSFFKYVNAIIFLNYKPVRKGTFSLDNDRARLFFETINKCDNVKIGFDSCSISGISQWMDVPEYLVEPCEAARFSAFISEDMKMYPCSFMIEKQYCGDLRQQPLIEIWQKNDFFSRFRSVPTSQHCKNCPVFHKCNAGCRLFPDINFCVIADK